MVPNFYKSPLLWYPKFCIGFGFGFGYSKMVFKFSIAWCDLRMSRAIVHLKRNHVRKPRFSRNKAILSDHFSI